MTERDPIFFVTDPDGFLRRWYSGSDELGEAMITAGEQVLPPGVYRAPSLHTEEEIVRNRRALVVRIYKAMRAAYG